MSKLAHSNQETMDEIERKRAIENGDEDCLRTALGHCVRALAEYERKPGDDLRPFLLGALDAGRKALAKAGA